MRGACCAQSYLLIYLQHYVKLATLESSILIAVAVLVGGILMAYPFGLAVDRWGRRRVALLAVAGEVIGLYLFSLAGSFLVLAALPYHLNIGGQPLRPPRFGQYIWLGKRTSCRQQLPGGHKSVNLGGLAPPY